MGIGRERALQYCSEKFLRRIIETLEPRLIIALGRPAAQYFFQFNKLNEILEIEKRSGIAECIVCGRSYKCLALPHPSPQAIVYQKILETEGMKNCLKEAGNYLKN
ncbi:MAG: uracil-DNA glycosylase family protein [Candidatus Jordarchaeaceae archaeon]